MSAANAEPPAWRATSAMLARSSFFIKAPLRRQLHYIGGTAFDCDAFATLRASFSLYCFLDPACEIKPRMSRPLFLKTGTSYSRSTKPVSVGLWTLMANGAPTRRLADCNDLKT